jgi:hypothetical protein
VSSVARRGKLRKEQSRLAASIAGLERAVIANRGHSRHSALVSFTALL